MIRGDSNPRDPVRAYLPLVRAWRAAAFVGGAVVGAGGGGESGAAQWRELDHAAHAAAAGREPPYPPHLVERRRWDDGAAHAGFLAGARASGAIRAAAFG